MRQITIGTAQRPALGQQVCGDAFIVADNDSVTTIGIADGLGHGPEAAEASNAFCAFVQEHHVASLKEIILGSDKRLGGTRGAAAALLRIDLGAECLEFAGVGNIEVHAESSIPIHPICVPGILGQRFRKFLPFHYEMDGAALITLFSDGISSRFEISGYRHLEPQEMAEAILKDHGKDHDDATCVVVRY